MCTPDFGSKLTEICGKFSCPPETLKLAQEYPEPAAFIAQLRGMNMNQEAVEALARILPPEKSVEWAETCAQMAGEKAGISAEELQALEAAKTWSFDPTDVNRLDAELAAAKVPSSSPAMWVANAAAWSKPLELPEPALPLPFAGDLTARAVVGAVRLSSILAGSSNPLEAGSFSPDSVANEWTVKGAQGAFPEQAISLTADQQAEAAKLLEPFLAKGVDIAGSVDGFTCSDPLCNTGQSLAEGIV
jgi:hypothetical protein